MQQEVFPAAGPMDTLTGYPLSAQANSTGLLGPYSVGWSVAFITYGLVLSALFNYLRSSSYQRDARWRKVLTASVVVLNSAVAVALAENSFHWSTLQKRSTENLEKYRPWDGIGPLFSGILGFLVQGMFVHRAFALFESRFMRFLFLAFVFAGMLVALAGAFIDCALSLMSFNGTLEKAAPLTFQIASGIWLWASAFVDILNTSTLCILLKKRVKGFNKTTDGVISQLILLSVETGAYTTLMATIGAIVSISFKHINDTNADYAAAFWIPLPSLYSLSLFTTLASRDRLASRLNNSTSNDGVTPNANVKWSGVVEGGIHVHQATEISVDLGGIMGGGLAGFGPGHELQEKRKTFDRSQDPV